MIPSSRRLQHESRSRHGNLLLAIQIYVLVLCLFDIIPSVTDAFSVPAGALHERNRGQRIKGCQSNFRLLSTASGSSDADSSTTSYSRAVPNATSAKKEFVNPETIAFNNKLNSMARNFDETSAEKVETLLRTTLQNIQMGVELEIEPNVVSFTAAISAWARSTHKDAAQRAEAILKWMIELSESDDNIYLNNVTPNAFAYNAAISAWIRSRDKTSHDQAERLLNQLWDRYKETQNPDLKPKARSFNLVINAIARSREPGCADRAAALLNRMEEMYLAGDGEMEPDSLTFGAIINSYANSGVRGSSDKAAQLLQRMESLFQLGYDSVKPNTFVFNACLNAFAKSSQLDEKGDKANQLLNLMERQYHENGDASVQPDVITYSTCINAWASSNSIRAGIEADALLERMTSLYLLGDTGAKPNAIAYTAAIKAWSTSASVAAASGDNDSEQRDEIANQAAKRALEILQLMTLQYLAGDRQPKPNKATFDLVCQALASVKNEEKREEIEKLRQRILGTKMPRRDSV